MTDGKDFYLVGNRLLWSQWGKRSWLLLSATGTEEHLLRSKKYAHYR